jgi:hypothetical protein
VLDQPGTLTALDAAVAGGAAVEHLTLEYEGDHPEAALVASLAAVSRVRRNLAPSGGRA